MTPEHCLYIILNTKGIDNAQRGAKSTVRTSLDIQYSLLNLIVVLNSVPGCRDTMIPSTDRYTDTVQRTYQLSIGFNAFSCYNLGAIYLGRPANREGVVLEFRTNLDRGRGGF